MSRSNGAPVIAIGIDAAQPTVIREMIEQDELPILKSLLSEGKWINVESSEIGGSAVWPSFLTGEDEAAHGIYAEWCWEPATMSLGRFTGRHLKPFWRELVDRGKTAGILAVPFMPFVGLSDGFEINEWGPFLLLDGGTQFVPAGLTDWVTKQTAAHPLSHARIDPAGPEDHVSLQNLISSSLQDVEHRGTLAERLLLETKPDFSIIVFTEAHHAGHCLWHTVEPENEIYNSESFQNLGPLRPTFKNIYQEVDKQIGRLVEAIGPSATVLVFSLHGMRPARGVPAFLEPLMREMGFAQLADWKSQSWAERSIALLAALKRRSPNLFRKLYYKSFPPATILRLARPTMLPLHDWSRTRAFSLPSEQQGFIQINLRGREARGIVPVERYEETCQELEQWLRSLVTPEGKPLVRDLVRTAERAEDALKQRLPDLVVNWEDVVFAAPLRIRGSALESYPEVTNYLSQHTFEGFCILRGRPGLHEGLTIQAKDLHRVVRKALEAGSS